MTTRKVSKTLATKVLKAVEKQFAAWIFDGDDGPSLYMEYGPSYGGEPHPAVLWEGGPYDWAIYFGDSYIEEEFGFRVEAVAKPDGVFTEPVNGYVLGIFPPYVPNYQGA